MGLSTKPVPISALSVRAWLARLGRHLRASAATRRRRSYYRRLIGV